VGQKNKKFPLCPWTAENKSHCLSQFPAVHGLKFKMKGFSQQFLDFSLH